MFAVGDIIAETYRIERLLGEGGMAYVFLVSHTRLPKRFALKLISQRSPSASFIQRFRREAEVLATLSHPHIVSVLDWNQTRDGQPYLVMELLDGEDLSSFLRRTGALPPETALSIAYQIGQALQSAHASGIIHRDLKPGNVFLCNNGPFPNFVKVLDFGIAKVLRDGALTADQSLLGTPAYMSPEQARGQVQAIDHRSDQFSLAIILYEMLTGRQPFVQSPEEDPIAILGHIIFHEPLPLPPALSAIWPAVQRALQKDPQARHASIKDFLEAAGARRGFSVPAPTTFNTTQGEVQSGQRSTASASRSRQLLIAAMVCSLGAAAVAAGLLRNPLKSTELAVAVHPPAAPSEGPAAPSSSGSAAPSAMKEHGAARQPSAEPPPTAPRQPEAPAETGPPAAAAEEGPPSELPPQPPPAVAPTAPAGERAVRPAKPPRARTSVGSGELGVLVSGASEPQARILIDCAHRELKGISGMPRTYRIKLERSGVLHITESPPQVYQTDLSHCIRTGLSGHRIPESVTLTIRGGR